MSEISGVRENVAGMIREYALKMTQFEYEVFRPRIFVKYKRHIYATEYGADFSRIAAGDIEDITQNYIPEKNIFATLQDYSAMVECLTPYCKILIRSNKGITAQLDETAQLLGRNIQVVSRRVNRLSSAFRSSAAALVKPSVNYPDGLEIVVGRNVYEAVTALSVLEKSAEVALKAEVVGGGKPLSRYAAMSERMGYILAYREMYARDKYGRFTPSGRDKPAGGTSGVASKGNSGRTSGGPSDGTSGGRQ
ncbi:MAG: hypothetical protein ACOYJO_02400 [Eubacterium sp.]|jgi:predicted transcriptional regulator